MSLGGEGLLAVEALLRLWAVSAGELGRESLDLCRGKASTSVSMPVTSFMAAAKESRETRSGEGWRADFGRED